MGNFKIEHKTPKNQRDNTKKYEENIRQNDPEKYLKRLEYHRNNYRKMKEALQKIKQQELMYNTHEIIVD